LITIGLFGLMLLLIKDPDENDHFIMILYPLLFGFLAAMGIAEKFARDLRKEILPVFVEHLWPGAKYNALEGIPQPEFEGSKIFLYEINDYFSTNLIQARSENSEIRLAAIRAAYHAYGAKGSAKIFQGLFVITEFNKNTTGRTYVLPDRAERLLGRPGQELQSLAKSHGELVKTEDLEFEKYFAVYSTDQVEARYVLSPSFMQHLLEFRKEIKKDVFASFIDGKMYLGISDGTLTHSLKLSTPITTDTIETLSPHLSAIHRLIQNSLTTRIWTKE
jgi:hypothetical protein